MSRIPVAMLKATLVPLYHTNQEVLASLRITPVTLSSNGPHLSRLQVTFIRFPV